MAPDRATTISAAAYAYSICVINSFIQTDCFSFFSKVFGLNDFPVCQISCNPAFNKFSRPLSTASLIDLAPRLPPTTSTVFRFSANEKNFTPSLFVTVDRAIDALTGFPVTCILSAGKKISIPSVATKIRVAFFPNSLLDLPANEFDS